MNRNQQRGGNGSRDYTYQEEGRNNWDQDQDRYSGRRDQGGYADEYGGRSRGQYQQGAGQFNTGGYPDQGTYQRDDYGAQGNQSYRSGRNSGYQQNRGDSGYRSNQGYGGDDYATEDRYAYSGQGQQYSQPSQGSYGGQGNWGGYPSSQGNQGTQTGSGNAGYRSNYQQGHANYGHTNYGQSNYGQGNYGQGSSGGNYGGNYGAGSGQYGGAYGQGAGYGQTGGSAGTSGSYAGSQGGAYGGAGTISREPYAGSGQAFGQHRSASRTPKNYSRSDSRIQEDVNDALMQSDLDPSNIEVKVSDGEVTLTGSVESRQCKFTAEQIADSVLGVKDVVNQLRVKPSGSDTSGSSPTESGKSSTGSSSYSASTGTSGKTSSSR